MKYYTITPEVEKFRQIATSELEEVTPRSNKCWLSFRPESKLNTWDAPLTEWVYGATDSPEDYPEPDIAHFFPGVMALSSKALDILKPCLPEYVELLPLTVDGADWNLIHFPKRFNAFDKELSQFDVLPTGRAGMIHRMVLNPEEVTSPSVFRVDGLMACFSSDSEGSFKQLVEDNGLTGIRFKEVEISSEVA